MTLYMKFQAKWGGVLYIVLETEVSFWPCLIGYNKKAEMFIPPSWVQLDYVVVDVIHVYLLK